MAKGDVLTLAILGALAESPLHGYELRKRLGAQLGPFRALSYGSLYPALKRMVGDGLIAADEAGPDSSRRSRISYRLTDAGQRRLHDELASASAGAWDDDAFDVRFALFTRTDAATRLRILEGRRTRLTEKLEAVRKASRTSRDRRDAYTAELQRHGLETVEREVEWLDHLIDDERNRLVDNGNPADAGDSER